MGKHEDNSGGQAKDNPKARPKHEAKEVVEEPGGWSIRTPGRRAGVPDGYHHDREA